MTKSEGFGKAKDSMGQVEKSRGLEDWRVRGLGKNLKRKESMSPQPEKPEKLNKSEKPDRGLEDCKRQKIL